MTDGSETATATITITVLGVNDAPTMTSDLHVYLNERNHNHDGHGARTTENRNYTFTGNDFSQLFNDVDGDSLDRIRLITNIDETTGAAQSGDLVNINVGPGHDDYVIPTGDDADDSQDIFRNLTSGEFRMMFAPDNNAYANTSFTYKVGDGVELSSATYTGYVNINAAPLAADAEIGTVAAGDDSSSNIITDSVTDADTSETLRITGVTTGEESTSIPDGGVGSSITGIYGTLVLNENGSYTYTANATNNITYGGTAEDKFNYTVKDNESTDDHNAVLSGDQNAGSDALDVGQIIFTVAAHTNVAPTSADNTVYVNENNTTLTTGEDPASLSSGDRTPSANLIKTFDPSDFAFTDTNTGQTLKSIQIVDLPSNGSLAVSGSAVSALDTIEYNNIQYLVYTPSVNSESNDSFTFKVIDTADEASADPYTMTIVNNAAPDVTNISASSIAAGGTSTGDVHDSVTDADDVDSDLVVTGLKTGSEASNSTAIITDETGVGGSGVAGSYGTLVIATDGTYTYTASATNNIAYGATGTDTFTFTTRDDETNTDANYAYDAGQITFRVGSSISLNTDTDTVNEDGIINTLSEGVDGVIDNDSADTDGLLVATVTSNNTSATNAAGSAVIGQYGILTLQPDGSYIYDTSLIEATDELTAGQQVTDVFTYEADGGATSTLTITVTGLGPLAANDTGAVNEDATITGSGTVSGTGVLGNDDNGGVSYESEDSTLRVTQAKPDNGSYTSVASGGSSSIVGTYGTLTLYSTGEYSYTPNNSTAQALDDGATATETFVYEIKDDDGVNASTANLVFNITGVNDVIVAVDDTDEVDEGSNVLRGNTSAYSLDYDDLDVDTADTYSTHEITAIRTKNEAAVDGTDGTIATPLEGDYGRLTVFADGSYNYQANNNIMISGSRMVSGQSVTDVFTYTVADGNGSTDTAILTITINGTDEPPIAEDDYTTVNVEDGSVTVNSGNGVSVNDADIEGDITVTGIENSSGNTGTIGSPLSGNYGNLVLNTDGSYTYTIDTSNTEINKIPEGEYFIEEFTYTITDEAGQTTTATIFIKINGKNDAPEAVDDTDELDLNTTTSVSRDLGSDYVVTSDDTDIDLNDYVYIQSFRTGESSGTGTSGTLNSSLSGTYGSLNLSTDGTYTYVSNSGLVDTLDPGQSVYDYFTYTISDSQGATAYAQLTIRLYGPAAETETETETEIDHRDLDSSFRNLVQRASLTGKDPYELPEIVPSLSTNFYEGQFKIATFSENLKLVDLRAQFKDKDGNYTTFSDGSPDDILVLQFSVFNDPGIELVRYKGEMKDGSALPSWIKVNPKSGVVVTEIPPDVDLLEFKVIGIDDKNNEYEIAVIIDAGELRQNRELAKEFAGEIDENISVNEDGDVEVQSDEEQTNNETENKSLNGNEVKIKSKKQINEFVKGDVFKPKPYLRDNKYIINLPDEIKDNLEKGIAVLRNGEKAPKWAKVNLDKGELILDPPKNLKNLDLTIITMDQEGNKISNEIKSKINKRSAERFAKQMEIKEQSKFVSLNDQVGNEKIQFDNYGEDILSRL
jgi:VCBS repeat-containing protein